MTRQTSLFEAERMTLTDAMELTRQSLLAHAGTYPHWVIAFSGGKDSSTTVAVVTHLILTGQVPAPASLTVLYADTGMELPPLQASAHAILHALEARGVTTWIVKPPLAKRFMVYMLGRGVPPPSNTFRWCTDALKIQPMIEAQEMIAVEAGLGERVWDERYQKRRYRGHGAGKLLTLTGVRVGESAARDQRIAVSCARNGSECGQGWLQMTDRHDLTDTLAPILHWRVCHVWDLLTFEAPRWGLPTGDIAAIYGGDEKEEVNARTGCVGCNLASRDVALDVVLHLPQWAYLEPLKRLRPLYAELKRPHNRLRKQGERRQDGSLAKNQGRMGPLTLPARLWGLAQILAIQDEINTAARAQGRPEVALIDEEDEACIRELIDRETWPDGWDGTEAVADAWADEEIVAEGVVQPRLVTAARLGLEEVG